MRVINVCSVAPVSSKKRQSVRSATCRSNNMAGIRVHAPEQPRDGIGSRIPVPVTSTEALSCCRLRLKGDVLPPSSTETSFFSFDFKGIWNEKPFLPRVNWSVRSQYGAILFIFKEDVA